MTTVLVTCTPAHPTIGRSGLFTELLVLGEACVLRVRDEALANTVQFNFDHTSPFPGLGFVATLLVLPGLKQF